MTGQKITEQNRVNILVTDPHRTERERGGEARRSARRASPSTRAILPIERECNVVAPSAQESSIMVRTSSRGILDGQNCTAVFGRWTRYPFLAGNQSVARKCCNRRQAAHSICGGRGDAAGAEKLVFITGSSKRAIEDHFDTDPELERQLAESGKHDLPH